MIGSVAPAWLRLTPTPTPACGPAGAGRSPRRARRRGVMRVPANAHRPPRPSRIRRSGAGATRRLRRNGAPRGIVGRGDGRRGTAPVAGPRGDRTLPFCRATLHRHRRHADYGRLNVRHEWDVGPGCGRPPHALTGRAGWSARVGPEPAGAPGSRDRPPKGRPRRQHNNAPAEGAPRPPPLRPVVPPVPEAAPAGREPRPPLSPVTAAVLGRTVRVQVFLLPRTAALTPQPHICGMVPRGRAQSVPILTLSRSHALNAGGPGRGASRLPAAQGSCAPRRCSLTADG